MNRHPSIRRRLLAVLMSTVLLVWAVALVLVYRAAQQEVEAVFDANLARGARVLQALLLHEVEEEQDMAARVREVREELGESAMAAYPRLAGILREYLDEEGGERLELPTASPAAGHRDESGLAFVARHADGGVMLRDEAAPDIPIGGDGYADLWLNDEAWRVFGLVDPGSGFVVQVGERQAFRAGLVREITRDTLMPLLLALPVLALLIWGGVGQALRPLERVAREVSRRAADALEPIDDAGTPREVQGLLGALNQLFGRVGAALTRERQFTADAAHELRTPLAAIKTHLQVARARPLDHATQRSLDQALEGVDRATHTVEQLLLLARADAEQARALVSAEVDLRDVATAVVSALSQEAIGRGVDLGMDAPQGVRVQGDAGALQVLLRNLVDNAVRYTPTGGTVTVAVGAGADEAWMAVLDDGPGVPAAEHDRIFDRFHRGRGEQAGGSNGSGLGLSIVRRIAAMHGAQTTLGEGLNGRGLGVRVTFRRT